MGWLWKLAEREAFRATVAGVCGRDLDNQGPRLCPSSCWDVKQADRNSLVQEHLVEIGNHSFSTCWSAVCGSAPVGT